MSWKTIFKKDPTQRRLSKKTVSIIAIIAMADVLVMAVPFYLKNVISSVQISTALGITPSQFSQGNSIYGYVALGSYFIGGYFADRVSLKKLTFWGLASVGLVSTWYAFIPFMENGESKIAQVYVIFALWSFLTCFIFWAALWKLLAQQGNREENGMLNGTHGSLNGIIGTVLVGLAYIVFYLFGDVWGDTFGKWGFTIMVLMFTLFTIINCILLWKFVPEEKNTVDIKERFEFKTLSNVLKNYKLWLVVLLVMGVYMYQSGLSVYVTLMQDALLIAAPIVVVVGLLRTYLFRFIFSLPAGKYADKTQKYILFIVIGLFIASVVTLISILIPGFSTEELGASVVVKVFVVLLYLMLGVTCWALVTNRWATIYEIGITHKEYATAVGFVSFIALSPDSWFWQIDSIVLEKYKVDTGLVTDAGQIIYNYKNANQISLSIVAGLGIVGMLAGIVLLIILKKEKKKQIPKTNVVLEEKTQTTPPKVKVAKM